MKTSHYLTLDEAAEVQRSATGFTASVGVETLRVDVIRPGLLRIKISRGGRFDNQPSAAVDFDPIALAKESGFDQSFVFETENNDVSLQTAELHLKLELKPFKIDVYRTDGSVVYQTALDDNGLPLTYSTLNDAFALRRKIGKNDAIYGLGEKTGRQNRRGRDFTLWNTDVLNPTATGEFRAALEDSDPRADQTSTEFDPYYVSIPFFYHQNAGSGAVSGSFVDNGYRAFYDFSLPDEYLIHFSGGQYTEYVFAGPTMKQVLEDYTWLTGRTALPPIWALGYHQCRWHAYDQHSLVALADKHRELSVPLDTLWLDIDYMDGYRVFTWNEESFPNLEETLATLKSKDLGVITIIDPGVKFEPGYSVFDSGIDEDIFCKTEGGDVYIGQVWPGNTAFPDFASAKGRQWWGKLNAAHVESGLVGIWNDMNEPATGEISPDEMLFDGGSASHARFHNQYATLMAMATVDGLLASKPELRTFVLSRAGSPGIQRYAANWLGDNMSRFDHLWLSMPMAAGLSLSGQSFVGADIGGFGEDSSPELFARWIQYGALTPFARNHNATNQQDQYVFSFGPEVLDIAREAIQLRYRLLPYIYSAFVATSVTGEPIQRPLVFDYQFDEAVREIDDQYLFGRDLLVAPVFAAGQTERAVYLPAGAWFDWNTDQYLEGGQTIIASAPLQTIPLFARAGSIVPMFAGTPQSTVAHYENQIELHVFVPALEGVHESVLQEDDGLTFGANRGQRFTTRLRLERVADQLLISGVVSGQGFEKFSREVFTVVLHGGDSDLGQRFEVESAGQDFELTLKLVS